ncbi:MAG: carboxypeptidase M32, partial [Rhodospirillales bacterium 12-71-4]
MTAYARLAARFARIGALGEAAGILHWDASAMMPPGGGAARGEQLATLAGLRHELLVSPEVTLDLAEAAADEPWAQANLALMRAAHRRATALPV